ncbi:MAG: type II secretion system F family protein [Gammaproteobacteria bacterium]|nr:type II secretion system F family protein [Gammaproteobacteria bacterium]
MAGKVNKAKKLTKQMTFLWEGTDRRGARHKGEIIGPSLALVKADLRRQGISPIKVKKKPVSLFSTGTRKRVTAKDIALFSRQLATMMSAGVPLVQSFDIISKGNENRSMQQLVTALKTDIEGGSSLAQALKKHPRVFDDLFCNLVKAGEQAGILESLLNKIAAYKEKTELLKSKIKKAMYYPVGVLSIAFIITLILLIYVVPQFETMFSSFGADLPAFTKLVVSMSEFVQDTWLFIFGGVGLGLFAFVRARQHSDKFNYFWDGLILKMPVIGPIMGKAAVAQFARTLGTMFTAGVPLVEAMESVAGATGNRIYNDAILKMRDDISTGMQLQTAMMQSKLFPNMTVQMVAIGEESGSLDSMLSKIADFYEQEVDDAVDGMSSMMEPLIMVVLGVLIGGLVLAMYLPIFQMGKVF